MAGMNGSAQWAGSDAVVQGALVDGCHIVLETAPPDYVEKISRYLESSVPGSQHQDSWDDSDSGDSLFLTQKPVPEAVRTGRRRHRYDSSSDPRSTRNLLESEDDYSRGESKDGKERRRKKHRLPKYKFPFLKDRKWKPRSSALPVQQNTSLHNYTMAGFFKCVREHWQGCQRRETLETSLLTVDADGEYISPLSEEEEERTEDEDMKVVEKKCFVVLSKAKRQQKWDKRLKSQRGRKTKDPRKEKMEKTQGRQWKMVHKKTDRPLISKVTPLSSDKDGELSGKGPLEKERNHKCVRGDVNSLAQTKTPKTERRLTRRKKNPQKAQVEEPQSSPKQCTQEGRGTSTTETESQTCAFHRDDDLPQTGQAEESQHLHPSLPDLISDTNDDRVCAHTGVKRRKKGKGGHESGEGGQGQKHREEPRGLDAATCVTVELEEAPRLSEDDRAEPPAPRPCDEPRFNENNCMETLSQDDNVLSREEGDIPNSEQRKRKRKRKESMAENVEEAVGNLDSGVSDSVFSASCEVEDSGQVKKKKKKRKRSVEDAEPLNDVAAIQKEKKKRKKEGRILITEGRVEEKDLPPMTTGQLEEYGHNLESTLESSYVKRKKHITHRDAEKGADVSFPNDAATLSEEVEMPLKKKKKKKKKKTLSEDVDFSQTPEVNEKVENADNTPKTEEGLEVTDSKVTKKKKRKIREISSRNISEDAVTQSDDSVSVREKEKKGTSSFLVADAGDTDTQTHVEPDCLEETNSRVRKKKKKRKMPVEQDGVEKDHEQNFEEPNKTCLSPSPQTADAEVKRTKKLERSADDSPTDEAMVLKKKKQKKKKKRKDKHCDVIQESPPAATRSTLNNCGSASCKEKGKQLADPLVAEGGHSRTAEVTHGGGASDQVTKETVNTADPASSSETPTNQASKDRKEKKKVKKSLERKSSTKSAELEPPRNKKQSAAPSAASSSPVLSKTFLSKFKTSSSDSVVKKTAKRRLHNTDEDFFTDC